jgi:lipopolysaccharide export system permease protein
MKLPYTISLYFGKQFLLWLGIGIGVCASLIFLMDMVEVFRQSAKHEVGFDIVLQLTLLHLPNLLMQIAPFAFLFGAILCFTKLTRTRELVIARASGISVWQFLFPALFISFSLGMLLVTVVNPVSAMMSYRAAQIENKYFGEDVSEITVSKAGLWLKQRNNVTKGETLITATSISPDSKDFKNIIMFDFDAQGKFLQRIDANEAKLLDNEWLLRKALVNKPDTSPKKYREYHLPTNLSLAQIQDSFSKPETVSFWALPEFIKVLEESGFSALRHKIYLQSTLAIPFMLSAMILIAAVFSLRFSRRAKNGLLITAAVFMGFLFFFVTKLSNSFGMSGDIPILLAAWIPTAIFVFAGIWMLLHLEDG